MCDSSGAVLLVPPCPLPGSPAPSGACAGAVLLTPLVPAAQAAAARAAHAPTASAAPAAASFAAHAAGAAGASASGAATAGAAPASTFGAAGAAGAAGGVLLGPAIPVGGIDLRAVIGQLRDLSVDLPDAARVDRIRELEELKAAAAAAQARVTAAFVGSRRAERIAAGVKPEKVEQGIAAEVALAKRESPHRAHRYVGFARVLVSELPCTFAALQSGATTEARAFTLARETVWLTSREDRATVDAALGPRLEYLGDREVEQETRKLTYRLDPAGYLNRSRAAAHDRRVTLRPAPDTMTRLTALLPAAQGVAAYAALHHAAQTARATGDPRGRGQVMADTLVQRVTGQDTPHGVPVEITLVMTDHTLHGHHTTGTAPMGDRSGAKDAASASDAKDGAADSAADGSHGAATAAAERGADPSDTTDAARAAPAPPEPPQPRDVTDDTERDDGRPADGHHHDDDGNPGPGRSGSPADEPAVLLGHGPIPAALARDILLDTTAQVWVRRLYTHPRTGRLVALESHRRDFDGGLRHALIVRDQYCRTPWCAAPIRHGDHVTRATDGGPTTLDNGQGLCEACNYLKETTGWHTQPGPGGAGHSVITTTPTGHTYTSRPPDLPGHLRLHGGHDHGTQLDRHGVEPEIVSDTKPRAGPEPPRNTPDADHDLAA